MAWRVSGSAVGANREPCPGSGVWRMGADLRREDGGEVVRAEAEVGGRLGAAGGPVGAPWVQPEAEGRNVVAARPASETDDPVGGTVRWPHDREGGLSHPTASALSDSATTPARTGQARLPRSPRRPPRPARTGS